jgi:hypothetical protein
MSDAPRKPLPPRTSEPVGPQYYPTKEIPAFKGNTPEAALMGETMRRIETMHADVLKSVENLRSEMRSENKSIKEASVEAHEKTRRHVLALTHMFRVLWTTVKGSEPPPPPPPGAELVFSMNEPIPKTAVIPIDDKISSHDLSLAAVEGQLIAVSSAQNETKEQVTELLKLQKEQMGKHEEGVAIVKRIADTLGWLMWTSDGRKSLMIFLMFVAVVYDKLGKLVQH